jgi:natural product precursor
MGKKLITLNNLENSRLNKEDMKRLHGGDHVEWVKVGGVRCGCNYANQGGSSTNANHDANVKADLWTVQPHLEPRVIIDKDNTYVAPAV